MLTFVNKTQHMKHPHKWHPEMGDDYEGTLHQDEFKDEVSDSGVWKLKKGQEIGYMNGKNKIEVAFVHGFLNDFKKSNRKALHISTKRGHLEIDPYIGGDCIVDLPK